MVFLPLKLVGQDFDGIEQLDDIKAVIDGVVIVNTL
jgi:hypothetical protein